MSEVKIKSKRLFSTSDIVFCILFGLWSLLLIVVAFHIPETFLGVGIAVAISIYLIYLILNKPGYIFTETEIWERYVLMPFSSPKQVLKYGDADRYYRVYANFIGMVIKTNSKDTRKLFKKHNLNEIWFCKGNRVLFKLDGTFRNFDEMMGLVTVPFGGEMELTKEEYVNEDISNAHIIKPDEADLVEIPDEKVSVKAGGFPLGCMFLFIFPMIAIVFLMFVVGLIVEGSPALPMLYVLLFLIGCQVAIYVSLRRHGVITIDENKDTLIHMYSPWPIRKEKELPFSQVADIVIDREKCETRIYDLKGVWARLEHTSAANIVSFHHALRILKAKGKLPLKIHVSEKQYKGKLIHG